MRKGRSVAAPPQRSRTYHQAPGCRKRSFVNTSGVQQINNTLTARLDPGATTTATVRTKPGQARRRSWCRRARGTPARPSADRARYAGPAQIPRQNMATLTPVTNRSAIEVHDLAKTYGEAGVQALNGVTFNVGESEIFGYLGRNGAGKSTTVRILTTLLRPSKGSARVGGFDVVQDPSEVRGRLGVVLQEAGLDDLMTGREHLVLVGRLTGLGKAVAKARADELLETFGLISAADRLASRYSGGMRRRLAVAMALLRRPQVLFLDEPTAGLDPQSRRVLWHLIRQARGEGSTVFLTTQHLAEAEDLADRVCVLQEGRIAAIGTPQELKAQFGTTMVKVRVGSPEARDRARTAVAGNCVDEDVATGWLSISVTGGEAGVPSLVTRLINSGVEIEGLAVSSPSLEDVFVRLTGADIELTSDSSDGSALAAVRRTQGVGTVL